MEIPLQAWHGDAPPGPDLDCRAEIPPATKAVQGLGMKPEAAGRFRDRDEVARCGLGVCISNQGHFVLSRSARRLPRFDSEHFSLVTCSTNLLLLLLRNLLARHQSAQSLKVLLQPTNLASTRATSGLFGPLLEPSEPLGAISSVVRAKRIRSAHTFGPATSLATVPPSVGRSSSAHDAVLSKLSWR